MAYVERADVVEYLLEKTSKGESKVELGNNEGRTLLHVAALTDNEQLANYLLDKHHAPKSSIWNHKVSTLAVLFVLPDASVCHRS